MKSIGLLAVLSLMLAPSALSQEWTNSVIASQSPKDIVELLKLRIEKAIGSPAPSLNFQRLDDTLSHSLSDYHGRLVVLNLWGTNCSGCRLEMPALSQLHANYRSKGVIVLFLSSQPRQTLDDYFTAHPLWGVKGNVNRASLTEPYQMLAMPCSFIIDAKGVLRDAWIGPATYDQLEKKVAQYVVSMN